MTKIFALSSNVKEGDEKSKEMEGITISSTTPQTTLYPITLPISSIVAKKRYGTSHLFLILLSLITISILFYMIPDFFYKRVHHLVSNEVTVSGSTSPWILQPDKFDMTEDDDTHISSKFDSFDVSDKMNRMNYQNRDMIQRNHGDNRSIKNQDDSENTVTNDNEEMKQQDNIAVPNRIEAMKAITTLLEIPGVQRVTVVQNNDRIPENIMMKPEFVVPDEKSNNLDDIPLSIISSAKSLSQLRVPPPPQMEMKEWELMNYRRAIREWLLRREMFRRRMLAEMERERQEAAERKMSQFIMGLQLQEQHELPQVEQLQSMLQMLALARMNSMPNAPNAPWMNNVQSSMDANQRNAPMITMISPPVLIRRIPPMYPFITPKQQQQQQQQQQEQQEQQQQPAIIPIKLMPPQILNREEPIIQPIGLNSVKPNITPLQIRDDTINRLDLEQKKIPVPVPVSVVDQPVPMTLDGTPDRDIIFKELRSRAQMQQQMSQNALPAAMIPPLIPNIVPATQINSDEIFREMQHRALQMQIEQDRLESEQQRVEKEKSLDAEIPVLMIADTFPRRSIEPITERTSDENAAEITTTTTKTKTTTTATAAANSELITKDDNSGSSSESLSAFLNIFNKGIQGSEITNSPNKEQKITIKNDDIKVESEHLAEENTFADIPVTGNDGTELIIKPDETVPQVNFIQEFATTEAPANIDTSDEAHSEMFKSVAFQGESDDVHSNDMLGTPIRLLQTSQIQ
ncbi:Uncharacterized protein BM_BM8094 [Brugia malayi]|uniref:Uncharacterized protein n=2 Tax=Brugia TaxID=6278 RepID=A0A4E9F1H1_BRUMA|nr:Uncharacterized protein BM_BM8094 [Brugia malayi]VIO90030.1 Uncharacterized protein BM_BM8094 [Brugia malayi]